MMEGPEVCPVCDEEYNHFVDNGHRNSWPTDLAKVAVCTTEDSDWMFVHVTEVKDE